MVSAPMEVTAKETISNSNAGQVHCKEKAWGFKIRSKGDAKFPEELKTKLRTEGLRQEDQQEDRTFLS